MDKSGLDNPAREISSFHYHGTAAMRW